MSQQRKRDRRKWEDTMKQMTGGAAGGKSAESKSKNRRETRTHLQRKQARRWTAYSSEEDKQRIVDARLEALEYTDYRTAQTHEEEDDDDDYEVRRLCVSRAGART